MDKLNGLSSNELLNTLVTAVKCEKELTFKVLCYLREVEFRQIHLEKGYSSLFVFCVEYLNYSEPEAQIRIQAMRLLKTLPSVEEKIKSGEISLSVAANVQSHFRKEDIRRRQEGLSLLKLEEKVEIVSKVEKTTARESSKVLATLFPESSLPVDKVKPLSETKSLYSFGASNELIDKLARIKDLIAHKAPAADLGVVIELIADMALEKLEKKSFGSLPHGAHKVKIEEKVKKEGGVKSESKKALSQDSRGQIVLEQRANIRTYISSAVRHEVWMRAKGKCTYVDPDSKKMCGSRYALQIEHIEPVAMGGTNDVKNLTLLCRAHNTHMAFRKFGDNKMRRFYS